MTRAAPRIEKKLVSKKEDQLPSTMRDIVKKIVALEFYNLELITALA